MKMLNLRSSAVKPCKLFYYSLFYWLCVKKLKWKIKKEEEEENSRDYFTLSNLIPHFHRVLSFFNTGIKIAATSSRFIKIDNLKKNNQEWKFTNISSDKLD